jgi:Niemann-Pick C1 protein
VFLVTLLLLQDPWMSVLITGSVAMVEANLLGLMYLWDISLNAISVVNLVMCIGIAVEFHTHIAHSFLESESRTRTQRAIDSLSEMGSSVLSGNQFGFILLTLCWVDLLFLFSCFYYLLFVICLFLYLLFL